MSVLGHGELELVPVVWAELQRIADDCTDPIEEVFVYELYRHH